ncbi:MAG: type II toxin-antitoxin system Phd/YefM family antitoxin [Anaerolineae bacterium]
MPVLVSVKSAKAGLSDIVNRAAYGQERIIITSRGRAKAALISVEDLRRFEELELEADSKMLARAMQETTEFQSLDDVVAELLEEPDES